MSNMITITGRDHQLDGRTPHDRPIEIHEIAHSLAMINRFNGHTHRPYSVAEHSLLVANIAEEAGASPITQLAALLHDAHEAYIGDISSPVKWQIGDAWAAFERHHQNEVQRAFGIHLASIAARASIKQWDLIALATERRDLTVWQSLDNQPWPIIDTPGQQIKPLDRRIHKTEPINTSWLTWRGLFLDRFNYLQNKVKAAQNQQAQATSTSQAAPPELPPTPLAIELQGVDEEIRKDSGAWRSCSGCHETNEGHAAGPWSAVLRCHLGNGCGECGGIGAIWDSMDWSEFADDQARAMGYSTDPVAPGASRKRV